MDSSRSFSPSLVTSCRFWLAANSIWGTLVLVAPATVAMRLLIAKSWLLIAFVILLAAVFALRDLRKSNSTVQTLFFLVLGLASAGFILWPCLSRGAFPCVTGDTFMYSAFGQYLVDHSRGLKFDLSPVDQYAAGLSESRFGTASVLGFLAVLFHSTTIGVLPVYIFIILANIFSGFVLLSRRFGCNRMFSLAAGFLAVIGGWAPNALNIGGLDNLLFLSLFPFLVARLELYRFGYKSWTTSLGLAIVASSVFYAYPEGLAIAGVMFLPFFCESLWSGIYVQGRTWRRYVVSACLVLILISPYAQVFFTSLFANISIHMSRGAAGLFPGLLSPRLLPAMFAFGQEYPGTVSSPRDAVLPIIMLAFIVLGGAMWIRRRKSLILALLILIMMAIWQGWLLQYDYGLYKILFIGSLVWIPSLFRGGTTFANFVPRPTRPFVVTLGTIIFLSAAIAQRMEQQEKIPWRQVVPMKWYSELAGLQHKVGNRPVLLVCDSAFDQEYFAFDQEWAVFFLRHVNLKVPEYFGYLGAGGWLMPRAKSTSEPPAFLLVSERLEGAVWNNQRFSLLELAGQPRLIGVQAPNALEQVSGKPFVWLGKNTTRFLIVSKIAQTANFSALECLNSPRSPQDKDRQIHISIGGKVWKVDVSGALFIEVPLKPGLNVLEIACQDFPTVLPQPNNETKYDSTDIATAALQVLAQPNGDTRGLPLGLWDYRISSKEEVSN
jgi:hypothetical protein